MTDKDFYAQLLGLGKPWEVISVELDLEGGEVVVEVGFEKGHRWRGEGGEPLSVHGYERREWRHLDTCQMRTTIRTRVPRLRSADGTTRLAEVPWAGRHGRFTLLFEAWAVRVLQASANVVAGAGLLGLSWDQAHGIMGRAVARGLARRDLSGAWSLAFDEKSFRRGQSYVAVMAETCREGGGKNRVLEVAEGADAAAFGRLWESLPEGVAGQVEVASMDMGEAPRKAAREHAPGAAVVYDRFHVMAKASEAVDAVRRAEHKRLAAQGDDLLKGSKQLWLYRPENLPEASFNTFSALVAVNTATSRAWVHKEVLAGFWEQPSQAAASAYIKRWLARASRSWQEPVKRLARTVREHLDGLLAWFDYPVSNGPLEGLNSRIQAIKSAARGFRSYANYRVRILFYLGDLDMAYHPTS